MALSFLGLNSHTGDDRRLLLLDDDSVFSSRPGSDPFFGKHPRTGSAGRVLRKSANNLMTTSANKSFTQCKSH